MEKFAPTSNWLCYDDQPLLRKKLQPLTFPLSADDQVFLNKMQAYIDACFNGEAKKHHIANGIGIAASQVGFDKKAIYLHFHDADGKEQNWFLGNPEIIYYSKQIGYLPKGEGCLSVKENHKGIVPRHTRIGVKAIDLLHDNKPIEIDAEGILAICLQHEIDHLSGVLYYDHINKDDPFKIAPNWVAVER